MTNMKKKKKGKKESNLIFHFTAYYLLTNLGFFKDAQIVSNIYQDCTFVVSCRVQNKVSNNFILNRVCKDINNNSFVAACIAACYGVCFAIKWF